MRALFLMLFLLPFPALADAEGAGQPWLTYRVQPGELAIRDNTPRVSVFADGRVQVYRPMWQKKPGLYEYRLDAASFSELVATFTAPDVIAIDLAATEFAMAESAKRIATEDNIVYAISDPDIYHVEIEPGIAPKSLAPGAKRKVLVWEMTHPALAKAARVPGQQQLASLRTRLEALATIESASRIGEAKALQGLQR